MENKPKILQVSKLFLNEKYEVPIYQRNYAWEEKQIEQLIDDIYASNGMYFLGNLIVNQKDTQAYEVIDGQQRLTTLYLLQRYLKMNVSKGSLYFEAREKSNRTLAIIGTEEMENLLEELQSKEVINGFKIIKSYFQSGKIDKDKFRRKLDNVQLIRIQVPQNIDLNHYFEIMNTRGEQLEFHEIAKAKLLSMLSTDEDKKVGALIWDACSIMDAYVQMNFNKEIRSDIFTNDWSKLKASIRDFNCIREKIKIKNTKAETGGRKTLLDILKEPLRVETTEAKGVEENERFESIISFPNFILQVNKVMIKSDDGDYLLDDKYFLKNIEQNWNTEEAAKDFLYSLLKCRVLFDKYILKREFSGKYKEDGKWSLQRIEAYTEDNKNNLKPKYVGTFSNIDNKQLRTLQSCLRITYTSPKTMHWISVVLKNVIEDEELNITTILEKYCKNKIRESNYENVSGFGFERIVFTYLDYILYRDGYSYNGKQIIQPLRDEWQFKFRNSIEHFYPQNPIESEGLPKWSTDDLNGFGNLALITVSGNSKFSNLPPESKLTYKSVIGQSIKLDIMRDMINVNGGIWNENIASIHKEEMFRILRRHLKKRKLFVKLPI